MPRRLVIIGIALSAAAGYLLGVPWFSVIAVVGIAVSAIAVAILNGYRDNPNWLVGKFEGLRFHCPTWVDYATVVQFHAAFWFA